MRNYGKTTKTLEKCQKWPMFFEKKAPAAQATGAFAVMVGKVKW